jgi:hypothetical protein
MSTQDTSFVATGNSVPSDPTGFTAWPAPSGNIPFDQGVLGFGVKRGLIGLVDTGTTAPPNAPPAVSYTAKVGTFGGANTDTGAAGVSATSVGVFGQGGNAKGLPTGLITGVLGASAANPGVMGWSGKSKGVYGVSGTAPSIGPLYDYTNGIGGVIGASIDAAGVVGLSQNHAGVYAATLGGSHWPAVDAYAIGVGVRSWSNGPSKDLPSIAVAGNSTSPSGLGVGGSAGALGIGVLGRAGKDGPPVPNVFAAGVYGTSDSNPGVVGASNASYGVHGFSTTSYGVVGEVPPTSASYAGVFFGRVLINGDLTVMGSSNLKGCAVPFPDGTHRVLYCMESPEVWFEDFGTARLKGGRAVVKLDADFAKVIKRGDYHVFFTPKGDCRGLYVRRQGGASFEVRELQGGKANVAFSYRIVGRRKDVKDHRRFTKIDTRLPRPPRAGGGRKQALAMRALLDTLEKHRERTKPARARRQPTG